MNLIKNILFGLIMISIVFSGLSITGVTLSPDPMLPGGYGYVSATLSSTAIISSAGYTTGDTIERITIEVLSYYEGIEITKESYSIGTLDPGSSTTISFPIKIKSDAKSGSYLIKIKANGWVSSSGTSDEYNEKSSLVTVNILDEPLIEIKTEKNTIEEKEEFKFVINNEGGPARNLVLKVESPFSFENQNQIYVGDVETSKEISIIFDLSGVNSGSNEVVFQTEYYNELGTKIEDEKTLRLNVIKQDSIILIIQESEIISNKENNIKFQIKNTGNEIGDVKISFPNADLKLKESEKLELGKFSQGEEKVVNVIAFANLNPGLTQVDALLEWRENGEKKTESIKIPLTITSDVSIGIYLEAKPSPLVLGQEHTLVVLVSNLGSYKINNVELEIESDAFELLDVQAVDYIGEMNSDDFSTVQFKIKPSVLGKQNITVNIKYKDQSGEWTSEKIIREVNINPPVSGNGNELFLILGAVVIAILVWYFKFKKKKKEKEPKQG
ncbi:MAG: LPXTG cell wall anchor domain-containing protein [Candidatus Micrarchaeia archaeon]